MIDNSHSAWLNTSIIWDAESNSLSLKNVNKHFFEEVKFTNFPILREDDRLRQIWENIRHQ